MDTDALVYRIAFASLKGINPVLAGELISRVGSERAFFEMPERSLASVMGFRNRIFDDVYRAPLLEAAAREADFVRANGIRTLYYTDCDYPQRMSDVEDAPLMLYALGQADLNRGHLLAVVGTRHATPYGIDFVNRLVADAASSLSEPLTVISGLAFGIDASAHQASLKQGIPTVGVLAHGLNTIYPSQHRKLAADMVHNGGLLVTEYRSDSPVHKGNFIARNRIVASLCDALVVAESARKGGALITARLASGYNRDVFALPGRTSDRYSQGCNKLISNHCAALIQDAEDLMDAMGWQRKEQGAVQQTLFPELSDDEQTAVDFIREHGEAHISQLTMALNRSVAKVMALLIDMEFKGIVLAYPGGKYRLA